MNNLLKNNSYKSLSFSDFSKTNQKILFKFQSLFKFYVRKKKKVKKRVVLSKKFNLYDSGKFIPGLPNFFVINTKLYQKKGIITAGWFLSVYLSQVSFYFTGFASD